MRVQVLLFAPAMLALLSGAARADDPPPACPAPIAPIVRLDYGSRYTADSADRSNFDQAGDAKVTSSLRPIDDFIADLARQTDFLLAAEQADTLAATVPSPGALQARHEAAICVLDQIAAWAAADALSDLGTANAQMSVPSRIGGIAFAYAQVRGRFPADDPRITVTDAWLNSAARRTMAFFDTDAPPRASRNNLRAWAGLAVTRIGLTLNDEALIAWGKASAEMVACEAATDGSLPNEMWRGRLALHYQLHAVSPLVITAALLQDRGAGLFGVCDNAIPRIVDFTVAALADPAPVMAITGKTQSLGGPDHPPRDFELAWTRAYLRFNFAPAVAALSGAAQKLGNSKLGGDQNLLW